MPDAVLDLLADYASRTYLWLELGLESGHDQTLAFLNRGHTVAAFDDAVRRAQQRQLRLCTHVILGLPGESAADILATARYLATLRLDAVKLHHLHVVRHTVLERLYHQGKVPLLSLEDYATLVVDCLEVLPPDMIIMRLMGDAPRQMLVAPTWSLDKRTALQRIEQELEHRDTYQGKRSSAPTPAPSPLPPGSRLPIVVTPVQTGHFLPSL